MEPGIAYSPNPQPEIVPTKPAYQPPTKIIGLVIALVIFGLASTYAIKYVRKATPEATNAIPTPVATTPKATITPAHVNANPGWKDYVDPSNVFSVQYPPEYTQTAYSESAFSGIQLNYNKPASSASASAQIVLKIIYLQHSAKTAKQFAQEQAALEKNSTLDGLTVNLKGEWGRGKIIFMEKNGTVYRLSSVIAAPLNFVPGYEATVNRIFSSFTMLNPDDRGK